MTEPRARPADVMGGLSVAPDLAGGGPLETSLRTCVFAMELGSSIGFAATELGSLYYASLLRHLGCTAYSHEAAHLAGGDDHDLLRAFEGTDPSRRLPTISHAFRRLGASA